MSENKPDLENAKSLMEIVGKFVLGVLALCYAIGMFVVNIYYSKYGVYSLSLFQVNYVVAGLWVLAPIFLILFAIIPLLILVFSYPRVSKLFYSLLKVPPPSTPSEYVSSINRPVLLCMYTIAMFGVFILAKGLKIKFPNSWATGLGTVTIALISLSLYVLYKYLYKFHLSLLYSVLSVLLIFLAGYTIDFANIAYGTIPPHLGGGGTKEVQLLLDVDDSSKKYFESSGLRFHEDTNQTKTAKLLFATDDEYIFLVRESGSQFTSTLSIKRDLIKSVLYEGTALYLGGGSVSWDDEPTQPKATPTAQSQTSPSPSGTSQSPSPQP